MNGWKRKWLVEGKCLEEKMVGGRKMLGREMVGGRKMVGREEKC